MLPLLAAVFIILYPRKSSSDDPNQSVALHGKTPLTSTNSSQDKTSPQHLMTRVDDLMQQPQANNAHLREAIAALDQVLATHPEFAYGLRLRASIFGLLRDNPKTVEAYQTYLELVPKDAHARLAMTKAALKMGQTEWGLSECRDLYQQYPQFVSLLRTLQQTYSELDDSDNAQRYQVELLKTLAGDFAKYQPPRIFHPKNPDKKPIVAETE